MTSVTSPATTTIFSSEGLPPHAAPAPPPISSSKQPQNHELNNDQIDDGGNIHPLKAFEVFHGKLFEHVPTTNSNPNENDMVETPLQRLSRLKREVEEFENDIESSNYASSEAEEMTKLAGDLARRLEVCANPKGVVSRQHPLDLTGLVRRELEVMRAERGAEGGGDSTEGVVYELYPAVTGGDVEKSSLEERMARLEGLLGGSAVGKGSALERLEEAERMVKGVDAAAMEVAASRAKVIRADLEAASKARAKLSSSLSSNSEDAKIISSLHSQMVELEGVSSQLPAIVTRLQQLSNLHTQAADFSNRLTSVENVACDTERLLNNVEQVLEQVGKGAELNLGIIQENMVKLDQRMDDILS